MEEICQIELKEKIYESNQDMDQKKDFKKGENKLYAENKQRSPGTQRKLSDRASEYALVQYLSTLAKSKTAIASFDFPFVEYLLENGADINNQDIFGQSAFHIVAKYWNIDVARFLLDHGADINAQDCLGRAPLHEATALNYVEMVEFLLQNGADIDIRTYDQEQRPIHFAAKNDSCQTLTTLLAYGADINSLDSKKRTPLQLAAEMSRGTIAELLINEGASVAIYDDDGNSALTLLTEKLPDVALLALDQLRSVDRITRKEYFSLNNLEGKKSNLNGKSAVRMPLEIAVQNRRFNIVMHPVVQRLINVKWDIYGKRGAIKDLLLNLVYVLLWSAVSILLSSRCDDIYFPLKNNGCRITVVIAIVLFTGAEIRKQIAGTIRARRQEKDWIEWRVRALEKDLEYCHPRCPAEWKYFSDEIKAVRNRSYLSVGEGWLYVDWLALLLVLATIITHIIFLELGTITAYKTHRGFLIGLLLVLWIRIAKYARPFQSTGPIVVILAHILKDILKCAFLFAILFIPYACAFWVTYGSSSPTPVPGYNNMFDLLYNLLCMVVGIDFPFDGLLQADPFMARILCSSFIITTAIVVVNLLIALLSDTFTRLYSNAVANAMMQRAQSILGIEKTMGNKPRKKYYKYVSGNCSPLVISMDHEIAHSSKRDRSQSLDQIAQEIKKINAAIQSSKGKSALVQGETARLNDAAAINSAVSVLLKQSQEHSVRINKMYKILAKVADLPDEFDEDSEQNSEITQRRHSTTPGEKDCLSLKRSEENEGSSRTSFKRTRFCNVGRENLGLDFSEICEPQTRPSIFQTPSSEEGERRISVQRTSSEVYQCRVFPSVFGQNVVHLDRRDSTTESVSL